jgi:hypothetical protein
LGYLVYRYVSASGNISYLAPDLNFYPLVSESRAGLREEVVSLQRGDPAKELFLPPPDVPVRKAKDTTDLLNTRPESK